MKHAKQTARDAVKEMGQNIGKQMGPAITKVNQQLFGKFTSIKDMLGVKDESIEGVYGQAYVLYNTGRYKDAAQIFRLLIMLNSTEPKYLMGLAACYHMLKEFRAAGSTYNLVSIIDPQNPIPFFHASDCYIQVGDKPTAIVMLEMAVKRAKGKTEYATLEQRAQITLDALKKEITRDTAKPR